jgi:predicted HD superfamily hydrolase involved in NAD metabolism
MSGDLYRHSEGTLRYSLRLAESHLKNYLDKQELSDKKPCSELEKIKKCLVFLKTGQKGFDKFLTGKFNLDDLLREVYFKISVAAILHDYGKMFTYSQLLENVEKYNLKLSGFERNSSHIIHSFIAPFLLKRDFKISDSVILNAVKYHTTGYLKMNFIDKIIYISDKLESSRYFENIEILRKLSNEDIDLCLLEVYKSNIIYVIKRDYLLHPDTCKIWNNICGGLRNATGR